jgi:hypothetical protein
MTAATSWQRQRDTHLLLQLSAPALETLLRAPMCGLESWRRVLCVANLRGVLNLSL